MKTTFKSKTTCTRWNDDLFRIVIKDAASGVQVVQVTMTPHDIAMMLSGLGEVEGVGEIYPEAAALVGMTKEVKSVLVPTGREIVSRAGYLKDGDKEARAKVTEALHAAIMAEVPEGEGWKVSNDGLRVQQNGTVWKASVSRYVSTPTDH